MCCARSSRMYMMRRRSPYNLVNIRFQNTFCFNARAYQAYGRPAAVCGIRSLRTVQFGNVIKIKGKMPPAFVVVAIITSLHTDANSLGKHSSRVRSLLLMLVFVSLLYIHSGLLILFSAFHKSAQYVCGRETLLHFIWNRRFYFGFYFVLCVMCKALKRCILTLWWLELIGWPREFSQPGIFRIEWEKNSMKLSEGYFSIFLSIIDFCSTNKVAFWYVLTISCAHKLE